MPRVPRVEARSAEETRLAIEAFLKHSRQPALLEPGEELLEIGSDNFSLEVRGERLTMQAWDRTRNLARRVVGIKQSTPARLEMVVERFARREGVVFLVDLGRRAGSELGRRSERLVFRERFRLFLRRQFPEWNLAELSAEPNLQFSLSPAFPRAFLKHGQHAWAAIACPPEGDAAAVVSFGLIWLSYLRSRERRVTVEGLALYVPAGREQAAALRLLCLNAAAARFELFAYTEQDYIVGVDPRDHGNLDTRLEPSKGPQPRPPRGPEYPEALLEARVRAEIEALDADLRHQPVYGQVPAFAGGDRGILDLLAVDRAGRLAVVELKASADLHLPLQALDYWIRVKWHLDRGEFGAYGYFPGVELRPEPPRILLVSPCLEFHPSSETILQYYSPAIDVERIGLAVEWRKGLQAMFRLRGAEPPR
ncbi:MAG: hypothetical protein ABSF62_10540 [Bryobacteraceae bacterium]